MSVYLFQGFLKAFDILAGESFSKFQHVIKTLSSRKVNGSPLQTLQKEKSACLCPQ